MNQQFHCAVIHSIGLLCDQPALYIVNGHTMCATHAIQEMQRIRKERERG